MNREARLRWIATRLRQSSWVAERPDHPLLFQGPDLLTANEHSAHAFFLPTQQERYAPDRLTARLILSRLALPEKTQCVLVLDEDDLIKIGPDFGRGDFHGLVWFPKAQPTFEGYISESVSSRNAKSIPKEVRWLHKLRADQLERVTSHDAEVHPRRNVRAPAEVRDRARSVRGEGFIRDRLESISKAHPRFVKQVEIDRNILVMDRRAAPKQSIARLLQNYVAPTFSLYYYVVGGAPEPAMWAASVLLVNGPFAPALDPEKPRRAAAFAGWAIIDVNSKPDFLQRVHRLSDWMAHVIDDE